MVGPGLSGEFAEVVEGGADVGPRASGWEVEGFVVGGDDGFDGDGVGSGSGGGGGVGSGHVGQEGVMSVGVGFIRWSWC